MNASENVNLMTMALPLGIADDEEETEDE